MASVITTPVEERVVPARPTRAVVSVYGLWSFVASLLIFWVELMVAKMLLPRFGGSASVWNTALVFFQMTLLVGYLVAHLLTRLDSVHRKWIQVVLV
ncbi:MAG: spermidine synthase, partial [Acidimicrobiia bacterium]